MTARSCAGVSDSLSVPVSLNEHEPAKVLFMGLFRDLQARFASKQNLNPHKLAILFDERYTVDR